MATKRQTEAAEKKAKKLAIDGQIRAIKDQVKANGARSKEFAKKRADEIKELEKKKREL